MSPCLSVPAQHHVDKRACCISSFWHVCWWVATAVQCQVALSHSLESHGLFAFKVILTLHVGFTECIHWHLTDHLSQRAQPSPCPVFQQRYFYFPGNAHHASSTNPQLHDLLVGDAAAYCVGSACTTGFFLDTTGNHWSIIIFLCVQTRWQFANSAALSVLMAQVTSMMRYTTITPTNDDDVLPPPTMTSMAPPPAWQGWQPPAPLHTPPNNACPYVGSQGLLLCLHRLLFICSHCVTSLKHYYHPYTSMYAYPISC